MKPRSSRNHLVKTTFTRSGEHALEYDNKHFLKVLLALPDAPAFWPQDINSKIRHQGVHTGEDTIPPHVLYLKGFPSRL
jgi:hypothetical protein